MKMLFFTVVRCNVSSVLWICLTFPSGKELMEGVWKREAKLERQLEESSIYYIKVDQIQFFTSSQDRC